MWNYGTRLITKPSGLECGPYYYLFVRPAVVEAGKRRKGSVRQIHIPSYLSKDLTPQIMDMVLKAVTDEQIEREAAIRIVEETLSSWSQAAATDELGQAKDDGGSQCSTCSGECPCGKTQVTVNMEAPEQSAEVVLCL